MIIWHEHFKDIILGSSSKNGIVLNECSFHKCVNKELFNKVRKLSQFSPFLKGYLHVSPDANRKNSFLLQISKQLSRVKENFWATLTRPFPGAGKV